MNVPQNLRYNTSHEWVLLEGDVATIGISDHAQEELTDVVFVELPPIGKTVDAGDPTAVVESVKADPSLVNSDPYGSGWIFKVKIKDAAQLDTLLDAAGYEALIG